MIKHTITEDAHTAASNSAGYSVGDCPTINPNVTWVGDNYDGYRVGDYPYNTPTTPVNTPNTLPYNNPYDPATLWPPGNWTTKTDDFKIDYRPQMPVRHCKNRYIDSKGYHIELEAAGYTRDLVEVYSVGQKVIIKLHEAETEFTSDNLVDEWIDGELFVSNCSFDYEIPTDYNPEELQVSFYDCIVRVVAPKRPIKSHEVNPAVNLKS